MHYFVFDTETTGLNKAQAWEIACAVYNENGEQVAVFNERVRTNPFKFEPGARQYCPLTFWELLKLPSAKQVLTNLIKFVKENGSENKWDNLVVMHNAEYDKEILTRMLRRAGLENIFQTVLNFQVQDTIRILQFLKAAGVYTGKSCALDKLGLHTGTAHTALADVEATFQLYQRLISKVGKIDSFDCV